MSTFPECTFKLLYNLHLEIFKLVKKSPVNYFCPAGFVLEVCMREGRCSLKSEHVYIESAIYFMVLQKETRVSRNFYKLLKGAASHRCSEILTKSGLQVILKGKDYRELENVFPFMAGFVDLET